MEAAARWLSWESIALGRCDAESRKAVFLSNRLSVA